MNNGTFTKITNYKFLGKTFFSKEEIFRGIEYQLQIAQDYFNLEFNLNKKDQE